MFAREFHLTDVCVFWDSIFAVSADLSFVDQLSIAMLLYVEEQRTCSCACADVGICE